MKKIASFVTSLFLTFGAMAQVLSSHTEFQNGNVYYFETSRGVLAATANDANLVSSARTTINNLAQSNPYCQWTVYKSADNKYYLYNLGKGMFMGTTSTNNGAIPFTTKPSNDGLVFKATTKSGYPIMFTCNTNVGAVNHSTDLGNGLVYWNAGWDKTNDDGSSHKVTKIKELDQETLANIEALVLKANAEISCKAEVEGWSAANPNTHFGGITITCDGTAKNTTLTTTYLEERKIKVDVSGSVSLAYTREYRGFDFVGFSIDGEELGKNPTLTEAQRDKLTQGTPLVVKFTTDGTGDVTLFYDDDPKSYRIPAIATTGTGRIIAVSDYRHNLDDIGRDVHGTGTLRIDLVARTSDDNGGTWSNTQTIAQGDNSKAGSYLRAFGDAAIAAYGENILVMAAAGDVLYSGASSSNPNKMARVFSTDNGDTWNIEEMTTKIHSTSNSLIPSGVASFFGSGKLAVDPNYNNSGKARIYGALLIKNSSRTDNNYVVYTDDLGATWNILGGSQTPVAYADEPKIEILPNGQILLSARRVGGRTFNIFTYSDKSSNTGTWSTAVTGCNNGGGNGTNGEIFCIDAQKPDKTPVKLLLQSQPKGGSSHYDRKDVTIWYKEVSADVTYTPNDIANNWIEGKQLSTVQSSYSTMSLQQDGKIAFFFEEAPCYDDNYTKGYSMVYLPLSVEEITNYNYYGADTTLPDIATVNVILTDANGNEYHETAEGTTTIDGIEKVLTEKYPYITLGTNGILTPDNEGAFTYTNSVTLPFTVSNDKQTVWHNIYWPANTNENGYPIYLAASSADDQYVPKVTETVIYGSSSYNTLNNNDRISWSIHNVNNSFAFTLKNRVTDKYIQVTSVANGNAQNVEYVDAADATPFTIIKKTGSYNGDYSLMATVNNQTGYLCQTSASYGYATHYSGNGHQGAWVKFANPDYESTIAQINDALASVKNENGGIYTLATEKEETYNTIKNSMENSGDIKLNTLNSYIQDIATLFEGATLNTPTTGWYYRFKAYNNSNAYMVSNGISERMTVNTTPDKAASIFYLNENNQPVNYKYGVGVKDTYDSGSVTSPKETFTFTTNSNGFVIKTNTRAVNNNNNGEYLYHHAIENNAQTANVNSNSSEADERTTWIVEAVASLPITIASAGYSTLYAPVALEIPRNIKAYSVAIDGEWAVLNEIEDVIPANTGVVLAGKVVDNKLQKAVAGIYNFTITTTKNTATSDLCGGTEAVYVTEDAYILTDNESFGVCFDTATKNLENNTAFLNNSHRAYLPKPAGNNNKTLRFTFGEATGVEEVETENGNVKAIYDLTGRCIEKITKAGVYIIDSKKILIR